MRHCIPGRLSCGRRSGGPGGGGSNGLKARKGEESMLETLSTRPCCQSRLRRRKAWIDERSISRGRRRDSCRAKLITEKERKRGEEVLKARMQMVRRTQKEEAYQKFKRMGPFCPIPNFENGVRIVKQ